MLRCPLLISSLLVLVGCSLHEPVQVDLPVTPPPKYQALEDDTRQTVDRGPWWTAFKDENLSRLMQELFANNLELTQAYARLEQVETGITSSRSAQFPQVSASGEVSRTRQPGLLKDFTGDSQQLSVAASYELDLWGKLSARSKAAELDYEANKQELQALYLGLTARLADLYFLIVEQRAQLRYTEQTIASYRDTAERVERRYQMGLAPAVEMYQTRQSLESAKASRALYETQLAEAEHALAVLLGKYPDLEVSQAPEVLPPAPPLYAPGIPAELLANRPDLQAAMKRIEAADARVAATLAERLPSISLAGTLGTLRQEITTGLLKGEFWSLLGKFALPLMDGGRRRAEVDRQEALLAEAVARYQQAVLNAFRDVEDALINNVATGQRIERLAKTAHATSATLRLSRDRYLSGLTDYLPVLTAQRADLEAQRQLLSARRQLLAARISLARALGGVWMQELIDDRRMTEKDRADER